MGWKNALNRLCTSYLAFVNWNPIYLLPSDLVSGNNIIEQSKFLSIFIESPILDLPKSLTISILFDPLLSSTILAPSLFNCDAVITGISLRIANVLKSLDTFPKSV